MSKLNDKVEVKERIDFFLQILQIQIKSCNIALGWDEKQKKLVLLDVETKRLGRIELAELNDKAVGKHLF